MERLKLKYEDARRAISTLSQVLEEPFSIIIRDATIQRFEYSFEALWKYAKEYLREKEGIPVNSPKMCFRELFSIGILSEEDTVKCLEMTDHRNDTSHTYKEQVAEIIFEKVNSDYAELMEKILNNLDPES